jgi:CHAT domain-containing protein
VSEDDRLIVIVVTATGQPFARAITDVTRGEAIEMMDKFRKAISLDAKVPASVYLPRARQLHDRLIGPIENILREKEINNLVFVVDSNLRSLPFAALYDGEKFLVEKYSIGLLPSLSLTDTRYGNLKDLQILAMGTDTFENTAVPPLPGAAAELKLVTRLWNAPTPILDRSFTVTNLEREISRGSFGIVHLATHANFKSGQPENSQIIFYDGNLPLDRLRDLKLNDPPLELLVLSACRTALGDNSAELGFVGLATKAGVKSALGSLWEVSDVGTLGLMTRFYGELKEASIKAEALRQAQIDMIAGRTRMENGQLISATGTFSLPPQLARLNNLQFSHPYYWSGFTLVGSPW